MNPGHIFVKPASKEVRVRQPERGSILPQGGSWVPDNTYYRRRLKDGDVVMAEAPASPKPASKATKAE